MELEDSAVALYGFVGNGAARGAACTIMALGFAPALLSSRCKVPTRSGCCCCPAVLRSPPALPSLGKWRFGNYEPALLCIGANLGRFCVHSFTVQAEPAYLPQHRFMMTLLAPRLGQEMIFCPGSPKPVLPSRRTI